MRRRDFLKGLGGIVLACVPAALIRTFGEPVYQPIGHVHVNDAVARSVHRVTLNGREVREAFEFDDVEGWVRRYANIDRYVTDGRPTTHGEPLRIERLTGSVRVTWRT